jgi:hypothetical protein
VANVYTGALAVYPSIPAALRPRFIRLRDAPSYFGMDKNRFNREIRRLLTQIPIGRQGVAFDLLEMETAAEEYKRRNGRPAAQRRKPWDETEGVCQVSTDVLESGTSTNLSTERAFAKALEQATSRKPNRC